MGVWINTHMANQCIVLANTHVVMESRRNPILGEAIAGAALVLPDGMPLVVTSRWRGFKLRERTDGPGLMAIALSQEPYKSWRHYFYGSTPEVLKALKGRYPGANIVGDYSPPFRNLTPDEDIKISAMINAAKPDILWVGLGCPKQELWMFTHQDRLKVPVMVGIGQAFDILAGIKPRAPQWMHAGLE
jgi:N-acetylglucosaminyldiphosphoundecaprenol N-acetyl-beta-D-mannosaminyltransferase